MSDAEPTRAEMQTLPQIGSYRLIQQLGTGGMSSVFRAVHVDSGLEVAVKILPRSLAKNPTMLQRFLREAKSAESLQDPNIVEIFDRGTEGGRYYIVLEYMPGGDLHERVRDRGPLPVAEVVEIMKSVARGLKHAAERGLIHRDIKPANLLMTADGRVKITDLGLALQLADDERVTRDGTTVGTVDFMAPEQARDSRATSVKSDIYSLGCTVYYLLTGTPPFPGGDLPDKLRRHAFETAPDVRSLRPEVPEELAELVQRMMAKKPDRRFLDYDHLLMALDDLPIAAPGEETLDALVDEEDQSGDQPLVALIDDEDDRPLPLPGEEPLVALIDDDDRPLPAPEDAPLVALIDDDDEPPPRSDTPAPLVALIDEDDVDEGFRLGPGSGLVPGSTKSLPTLPAGRNESVARVRNGGASVPNAPPTEPDLSKLAELDREAPTLPGPRRPSPSTMPARPSESDAEPQPELFAPSGEAVSRMLDEEERTHVGYLRVTPPPTGPTPIDLKTLQTRLLKGVLAALILLMVGIGARQFLPLLWSSSRPSKEHSPSAEEAKALAEEGVSRPFSIPRTTAEAAVDEAVKARNAAPWQEPEERPSEPAAEPTFPAEVVAKLGLEAAEQAPPARALTPRVLVRRVDTVRDREHLGSLRRAFDLLEGTVEIADDGPFFEQDLTVHGRERLIQAAPGHRPVVVLESPKLRSVLTQPAVFVLNQSKLTIEGIDLVVRAADLPPTKTSLFLCLGSELTLRDCTITVEGPIHRPLSLVRLGKSGSPGDQPASKVRLERTFVRGPNLTALHLAEGPADVTLSRSVLICGESPAVVISGGPKPERRIALLRSVVATSDSVFELAGSAAAPDASRPVVRSLGTAFVRLEGAKPGGLVAHREVARGGPTEGAGLDWLGERNLYQGWPSNSAEASRSTVAVADLAGVQKTWEGSDASSRAGDDAWPSTVASDWTSPVALNARSTDLAPILSRVASPSRYLREKSIGAFDRQTVNANVTASTAGASVQELSFDALAEPWNGDLGRFLADQVRGDARLVRVRVQGEGTCPMTPIRLREGVSLEIQVEPTKAGTEPLTWRPSNEIGGEALIEVRHADLSITGARFARDARATLKYVVKVTHGELNLTGCRLTAPGQVEPSGGRLVGFVTDGTRPLSSSTADEGGDRPFCRLTDCLLITGGDALTAEVGRGVVTLANCAIASGSDALVLLPQRVRSDRFEADLWLDQCTIAAEQNFVRLGPWPGANIGPDRPWLVSSHACAFLDAYDRGRVPTSVVLLRVDVRAMALGALFWQSEGDAYQITHFVSGDDSTPQPTSFPDIRRLWVDLWGPSHILLPTGPGTPNGPEARFLVDRLKPGEVKADDLALDPSDPPKSNGSAVGADLTRMGITLPASTRRRER